MSRILRSTVPVTRKQRISEVVDMSTLQEKEESIMKHQKRNHYQCHKMKQLTPLEPGGVVWIPDRESEGTVLGRQLHFLIMFKLQMDHTDEIEGIS